MLVSDGLFTSGVLRTRADLCSWLQVICDSVTHRQLQLRRCAEAKPQSPFLLVHGMYKYGRLEKNEFRSLGARSWPPDAVIGPCAPQFANSARTPEPCRDPMSPSCGQHWLAGTGQLDARTRRCKQARDAPCARLACSTAQHRKGGVSPSQEQED